MKSFLLPVLFFFLTWSNLSFSQVKNPTDFPPRANWHELPLLAKDTVVLCMKYYFMSEDTIYFREAASEQVVKLALAEIVETDIFYGKDLHYAQIEPGFKVKNASFYAYYKSAEPFQYGSQMAFQHARKESLASKELLEAKQKMQDSTALNRAEEQVVYLLVKEPFLEKESGFLTKEGYKILTKRYYGWSENRYYFAMETGKNYFYLDTSEVASYQNIKIGNDKELATKKHPAFMPNLWVVTVASVGPVVGLFGAASILYLAVEVSSFDLPYDGVWLFISSLSGNALIYFKVLQKAVFKVRLVKAFKTAQHFVKP
jgi:hypothetical protein